MVEKLDYGIYYREPYFKENVIVEEFNSTNSDIAIKRIELLYLVLVAH